MAENHDGPDKRLLQACNRSGRRQQTRPWQYRQEPQASKTLLILRRQSGMGQATAATPGRGRFVPAPASSRKNSGQRLSACHTRTPGERMVTASLFHWTATNCRYDLDLQLFQAKVRDNGFESPRSFLLHGLGESSNSCDASFLRIGVDHGL